MKIKNEKKSNNADPICITLHHNFVTPINNVKKKRLVNALELFVKTPITYVSGERHTLMKIIKKWNKV